MNHTLAPFISLLMATSILLTGNGLFGTLIPLRAGIEGFSTATIGLLGSAYFIGFLTGCVFGPHVVRRAGHIRSFAALAGVASVLPLMHELVINPWVWAVLRVLHGFAFAGLYMVIESWINERATNETRGRLFSVYLIINFSSLSLGQFLLNVANPAHFTLFAIVSMLTSLALVPISLSTTVQPAPLASTEIFILKLYKISPVGMMGSFVVGLANAPFWTLGPVFAKDSGLDLLGVSTFMTAAIIGGAMAQWPIGRISDRTDRRRVILALCIGSVCAELAMVAARGAEAHNMMLLAGFLFGITSLTLYSVCVAHTNDHASRESFVSVSGGLLLVYALGAIVGPSAASFGAGFYGMSFIFVFGACIHALFGLFTLYRITTSASVSLNEKTDFSIVAEPAMDPASEIDPRAT
ncbi:MAG: MFS transporter [Parvibaculaceae bacterium]